MATTLWNIHGMKESLWVKWIHTEYLKRRDLWQWKPHNQDSPLIKNLESVRNELLEKNGGCIRATQRLLDRWFKLGEGTSEVYHWMRRKVERKFWQPFMWKTFILQKYSFCMWLELREMLATRDRPTYLGIGQLQRLCGKQLRIRLKLEEETEQS
ncbi:hypothetical protein C2S53_017302 [Perilla frutescens var. hirtella]|uniref:Reverse transcriptase zinc-binding domain-containing protein n=1 Tax=Perilla frutescens var. hirtella TaxID=608512 RepID=A0AAD4PFL6_PERFH|nr:hypothetical protein C2S53_017302 [Perilla frutescens var. hirtella]